VTFPKQAQSS